VAFRREARGNRLETAAVILNIEADGGGVKPQADGYGSWRAMYERVADRLAGDQ
jgi:hypothetical protein